MALRYKLTVSALLVLVVAMGGLAYALSYNAGCPAPIDTRNTDDSINQTHTGPARMRAYVYHCYGSPEVLTLVTLPRPVPAAGEVLVRVHAAGVNPLDWHYMRGSPYFMRLLSGIGTPDEPRLGVDFAGTVEAVGSGVTRFRPGDAVFGGRTGAFGEYLVIGEHRALAHKPANMTFQQAAAVPIAAITALQAVRDKGRVQVGQQVLVNGASGGVGTFAVQIARDLGAEVTGVSSSRNHALVRDLGATRMIDYRQEDYTEGGRRYDVIIDNVGNHGPLANRRALKAGGVLVMVGAPSGDWFAPLAGTVEATVAGLFVDEEFASLLAQLNAGDLEYLAQLMAQGKLLPVLDRQFDLASLPEAIHYSETGRARGKIVIGVASATP